MLLLFRGTASESSPPPPSPLPRPPQQTAAERRTLSLKKALDSSAALPLDLPNATSSTRFSSRHHSATLRLVRH